MLKITSLLIFGTFAGLTYASEPKEALVAFHAALASGDKEKALALLAPDIAIYESGYVERSRDEYAAHHLLDDIKFSKVATRKVLHSTVQQENTMAMIFEETETRANIKGKELHLIGTETTVLQKTGDNWRIVHLHWSSRKPK